MKRNTRLQPTCQAMPAAISGACAARDRRSGTLAPLLGVGMTNAVAVVAFAAGWEDGCDRRVDRVPPLA